VQSFNKKALYIVYLVGKKTSLDPHQTCYKFVYSTKAHVFEKQCK